MRICIVSDTLATMAGSEFSVVMTALALARRGHDVAVLAYRAYGDVHPTWARHLKEGGVQVFEAPRSEQASNAGALASAAAFLQAFGADIAHAIPMESLAGEFVHIARRSGAKVVIGTLTSDPDRRNFWYSDLRAENLRRYDYIVCASETMARRLRVHRLETDNAVVIPHILAPPRPPAGSLHWSLTDASWSKRHALGAITRLREEKGPDFLIAALAMICRERPETTLTIYGELTELERARAVAMALGVGDNIVWHGPFDGVTEIDAVVHKHCIFLLASLFESMPIALMEAVARGRLIVATDVGAVADLTSAVGHGRLTPVGDPRAMAEVTLALLDADEATRASAAAAATRYAGLFDGARAVSALEQLYRGALGDV